MSGKKSIIKKMLVAIFFGAFFLVMGACIFTVIKTENDDQPAADGFQRITAQVLNVESEEVQTTERRIDGAGSRHVTKYVYTADVTFEYGGKQINARVTGMPFLNAGDTADILYNPSTGQIKGDYSGLEFFFSLVIYIPAFILFGIGGIIILSSVVSVVLRLSVFREKNKVCGVIVEVEENSNVVIDHKHPKIAVCTFDEPGTGKKLRVRSGNSLLDLFSMVGMNVPIYYNRLNPAKSFVDLENTYGDIKLEEGQQIVHDFRNL